MQILHGFFSPGISDKGLYLSDVEPKLDHRRLLDKLIMKGLWAEGNVLAVSGFYHVIPHTID